MTTFAIRRVPRRRPSRYGVFSTPRPKKVAEVTVAPRAGISEPEAALRDFVAALPRGGGWRDPLYLAPGPGTYRTACVVLRRVTASGVYKGETVFTATEVSL